MVWSERESLGQPISEDFFDDVAGDVAARELAELQHIWPPLTRRDD